MELRQLESFREVVREGSFTAAARKLHMTQPAVSLHVKALEQHLSARLLHRDARGVRLTKAGAVLLEAADDVLASLEEATRRIREIESPERGSVVLACGDTVALHLLPPVITQFRKTHPNAEIQVMNHGSRTILEMVLRREADLGLVTRPLWLDPALQARSLHIERMRLALPRKHPLAAKKKVDLADLEGASAVLLAKPAETRQLIDRALIKKGVRLDVVMESGNLEVVKAYVRTGLGLSILPDLAITGQDERRLAIRPLPDDFPQRKIALVRRKDRKPGLLVTSLLSIVAEHFDALD
ncbi:MAG: LysR family transcriptional regulator [Planctomycetota bacterium]|nr:LysR family transcriptional regulator [Planctomycetota bacterium]